MPRKSNSTRKSRARTRVSVHPRPRAGHAAELAQQARLPKGLDRHRRADKRPPVIPGRLGGR